MCITSRCPFGDNYDDFYYKGSLEKYTSKGFILEGYEGGLYIWVDSAAQASGLPWTP